MDRAARIRRKIKAVMIGHAVGDALGVPVEFEARKQLTADPVTDMRGYGTYAVPAGAWSDDTSMSVAALDSIAGGYVDFDDIMQKLGAWCYRAAYTPTGVTFDIGGTCQAAIDRYIYERKSAEECGLTDENANGNGSLMRIHPFALMAFYQKTVPSEADALIDRASAITHAHERSRLACRIYTQMLHALLEKPKKESISTALQAARERYAESPEIGRYARLFAADFVTLPIDAIKSSGYVVDTLEAAVWCLLTTDSYRACVLKAVNLGEDTDTVGAVAGGLAGALYGYRAIPKEWKRVLLKRSEIEALCHRAAIGFTVKECN